MSDIISIEEIEQYMVQQREQGKQRIVFTNGCFDILHRGHVELLEKARALGDFLILGLNSDASVSRLKGPQRPLVTQEDRAYILSRLRAVDAVCIFNEDTPLELIKKTRPDVLIKGGDYSIDKIVGHEIVLAYGGQVQTIPLVRGRSTTTIMNRIIETNKQEGVI